MINTREQRKIRHRRLRSKVKGLAARPRMNVFRSLTQIYVQFIDDATGTTLAAASSKEIKSKGPKKQIAAEVGKLAAEKAKKAGVTTVAFDRSGYKYHGRIKALADAARENGLSF